MQETFRLLATNGGLSRLSEVIQCTDQRGRAKELFHGLVLPFLKTITHSKVAASITLEEHIGTVYNFLYGRQGDRANKIFNFVTQVLTQEQATCTTANIETILTALSNIVEGNSHALVNSDLKSVAELFLGHVDFEEMQNP